jgi:hypothetical protein
MDMFKNDVELFKNLDDFIYKSKGYHSDLRDKLMKYIYQFLKENTLDTDKDNFVDMKKIKEK